MRIKMDVIRNGIDFNKLSTNFPDCSTDIRIQFFIHATVYKWHSIFCAKYKMDP